MSIEQSALIIGWHGDDGDGDDDDDCDDDDDDDDVDGGDGDDVDGGGCGNWRTYVENLMKPMKGPRVSRM